MFDNQGGGKADKYGCGDMNAFCPEYCIGPERWLPRDAGNEVRSDSYESHITLRTEQCRYNDEQI